MPPLWRGCCWNRHSVVHILGTKKSRSNLCGVQKGEPNAGKVCERVYIAFTVDSPCIMKENIFVLVLVKQCLLCIIMVYLYTTIIG